MIKAVLNKTFFNKVAIEEDVHVSSNTGTTTSNDEKFNNSEFQRRKKPTNNHINHHQRQPLKATRT
jgi:hypothetical protein